MEPGEAWQVDVRFPHEVRSFGGADRVHLVIDVHPDEAYARLAAGGQSAGTGYLTGYYISHALPAPARRLLRLGN
jgi:hypothetical protein